MILIGLWGRLHSGKDTAVEFIQEAAEQRVVRRAGFADKMKLSGARALGFDPQTIDEALAIANQIKDSGYIEVRTCINKDEGEQVTRISGRTFWQRYGTEAHRLIYGDMFHVNALLPQPGFGGEAVRELRSRFPGVDVLVITDCRFENEAKRIIDLGGQVWYIDADKRLGPLPEDAHVSEQPPPPHIPVLTVPNNGSLEQFAYTIHTAWTLSCQRGTI